MHLPPQHPPERTILTFRLQKLLMVNALGEYARLYENSPDFHQRMLLGQHAEFVNTLVRRSPPDTTYELRITSHPDPALPLRGWIDVFLLVAVPADAAAAQTAAITQLLQAQFSDQVWALIAAPTDAALLPDTRYAVSIQRTTGWIETAAHRGRTSLAFHPTDSPQPQSPREPLFVVHPFVHSDTTHHALFGFLLQQTASITLSIRLQKTTLTDTEVRFLQENLAGFDEPHTFPASVADQLLQTQRIMHAVLLRLYDCAVLVNIDLVSALPIPDIAVTMVGNLLTQPMGGWYTATDSAGNPIHYHGGYTVAAPTDPQLVIAAVTDCTLRPIPASATPVADRIAHLVDASEAAMVFRMPRSSLVPVPGITMQSHRVLPSPRGLPSTGTRLGETIHTGVAQPVIVSDIDRTRHTYVIGQTGTGKSTVLKQMMLDDITRGRGICLIDPHGDLVEDMLALIPAARRADVIVIDPTQTDYPIGLNLFAYDTQEEREIAIQLFQKTVELVEYARGTTAEYMGPVFLQHLRNNAYWVTQDRTDPGTVIELYNMYALHGYYKRWLPGVGNDPKLTSWQAVMDSSNYHHAGNDSIGSFSYFASKFEDFVFDTRLRLMFGQKQSKVHFFDAINSKKIILINLSRGQLSEVASAFLGGVLLAKLQQAALKRAALDTGDRDFFGIYVDEFQNYTSDSFISLLSESRKYGISLTLANQFLAQITNRKIVSAVLGNVGTIVSFRIGIEDADSLKGRFAPEVTANDLINLPNWHAYVATQVDGQSLRPFSMQTIKPAQRSDHTARAEIVAASARRYGTPRAEVEVVIAGSMLLTRPTAPGGAARSEPVPVTFTLTPALAETTTDHVSGSSSTVVQAAGMIMWEADVAAGDRSAVRMYGIAPPVWEHYRARSVDSILPYVMSWGDGREATRTWLDEHGITTLGGILDALPSQEYVGEVSAQVAAYATAMLAYAAHDHPAVCAIRDIALSMRSAATIDVDGTATVWNARYRAAHHVIPAARAIAATSSHVYVLHGDGSLWEYDNATPTRVADIPPLAAITGGETCIVGQDGEGHVHMVTQNHRVGYYYETVPTQPFRIVAPGDQHTIGVDASGAVVGWGHNLHVGEIPIELRSGDTVINALAAGDRRSYALDAQGRLYAWGRYGIPAEQMYALNQRGVRSIFAIDRTFICQTKDGAWWNNGDPLTTPPAIDIDAVERIVCTANNVFFAISGRPLLLRALELQQVALAGLATFPSECVPRLAADGVHTVFEYLQRDWAEEAKKPLAFTWQARSNAETEAAVAATVAAHGITLPPSIPSLRLEHLITSGGNSGYYMRTIGPTIEEPKSLRGRRSLFDNDDFDSFFDNI